MAKLHVEAMSRGHSWSPGDVVTRGSNQSAPRCDGCPTARQSDVGWRVGCSQVRLRVEPPRVEAVKVPTSRSAPEGCLSAAGIRDEVSPLQTRA